MASDFVRQLRSEPVRLSLSSLPLFKVDGDIPDNLSALMDRLADAEEEDRHHKRHNGSEGGAQRRN